MKKSKIVFIVFAAILISSLFFSCQKDGNDPVATDNEVSFAINVSNLKSAAHLKSTTAYSLTDADKIILTIQNSDGSPTKYTSAEVDIEIMNGLYYTKKIVLKNGSYNLTEFLVVDQAGNTILAIPSSGSLMAQNVSLSLPIAFSSSKDNTTPVNVEVLSTETKTPEDFGLNRFPIAEVKTFSFLIGVADSETDELLSATLTVSNGSYAYNQDLDASMSNVVTVKDDLSDYTLTVVKTGYNTYNETHSIESLKLHSNNIGNLPLVVELEKISNQLSLGAWNTTTSFNIPRSCHTSVVYNGNIYVIGGTSDDITRFNDVQYAHINENGSLGIWQNTTPFNTGRRSHTSVVYNGYLYVIGGTPTGGGMLNDVQYAQINADGSLGTWQSTTSFNTGRLCHSSVVYDGYLYVIQGFYYSAASPLTDVQFAKFNADGSLGTWQTTTTFSPARWGHASIAYNGYIYNMGGANWNGSYYNLNDVQYASINANGSISSWQSTTPLNPSLSNPGLVEYNGYFIITGGWVSNEMTNEVKFIKINSDGSLVSWQGMASFNTVRVSHTSVVYNGYLYVIGGGTNVGVLNDVLYAKIN